MNQMPQRRRGDAREKILELAESAVLAKGFTATSIDELVAGAGITKSGFFYHFKDKNALAKAMILRYLNRDKELLDDLFCRADELNEDPLHGFLVGLKMFAELMADLPDNYPGCLAASFCYQDQLFDAEIRDLNAQGMLEWRQRFRARFEAIAGRYPPREPVDMEALADMTTVLVEGGLILGRALQDSSILPRQILMFRDYVRLVFAPG
ncbi:TetR/AcrR family transcriptional regulator [Oceanibaculum nanhaiense]|uniref:TetR/AcrR family transcriptional regulator n=1 Tax=Oceanibaculum nanhaiense TaxID=1909734 RepID=UPI00396E0C91